jgi:hypothetical protein
MRFRSRLDEPKSTIEAMPSTMEVMPLMKDRDGSRSVGISGIVGIDGMRRFLFFMS